MSLLHGDQGKQICAKFVERVNRRSEITFKSATFWRAKTANLLIEEIQKMGETSCHSQIGRASKSSIK
jgi:hypothetical protein